MREQTDKQQLEAEDLILGRMADLIQADPCGTALSMATASLALLAKVFPAGPSAQDRQHIQANLPGAAKERIADRAMSPEGTRVAVMLGNHLMRTAIDFSHPFQVVRPLHEGVGRALQRLAPRDWGEREEAAVTALAQQMGISRSRAREHLRQSRGS